MKKLLIAMAMMSAMAMAQTSGSTDQSTTPSSSTPQASSQSSSTDTSAQSNDTSKDKAALPESDKSAKADKTAGKEKTETGCLHKDGDNYWLKTHTGKFHVMSSQDLSAHDGHEVKISGTVSKAPMPGSSDTKKINHLEASNVEMVSDKCSMGEKSMKMKGDQMEKKDTSSTPK
jgi:uncharacterized protein YdeI (BOF family)